MGGWWVDGGQKGPLILFKFKHVNNYVMKLLKKGIKVVTNFLTGLKICDEVGVRGAQFSKIPYVGDFSYLRSKSMITLQETKMPTAGAH